METECGIEGFLSDIGLHQYLLRFHHAGFDSWESLVKITEEDLSRLNVPLGHRRKLQRGIARWHLWPDTKPLPPDLGFYLQGHDVEVAGHYISRDNKYNYRSQSTSSANSSALSSTATPSFSGVIRPVKDLIVQLLQGGNTSLEDFQYPCSLDTSMSPGGTGANLPAAADLIGLMNSGCYSRKQLINTICNAISPSNDRTKSVVQSDASGSNDAVQSHHLQRTIVSQAEKHLEAFIQRINHWLFFSDEHYLRQTLRDLTEGKSGPTKSMLELCLLIAIGASHSATELDHKAQQAWLYEGYKRLSSIGEALNDLWLMKLLSLLCLYHLHISERTAGYLLGLAIALGKVNGLESDNFPLPGVTERSQWLKLWETIRFLDIWFQTYLPLVCPSALALPDIKFHLIKAEIKFLVTEDDFESRITQMNLEVLSEIVREIHKDQLATPKLPPRLVQAHLQSLEKFRADLPLYLCLQPLSAASSSMLHKGANVRQKTSILNIHSLYLGTVCHLLRPSLIDWTMTRNSAGSDLIHNAQRCMDSAEQLIRICREVMDSSYSIDRSFVSLHFLFTCALVIMLDVPIGTDCPLNRSLDHLQVAGLAEELLNDCSETNPTVLPKLATLRMVLDDFRMR